MSKNSRAEYTARINRVLDHIEANLAGDLSLKNLAGVALFSPYYFHRIFSAMVGETPNQFINRLRLEKAAAKLITNPGESITAIALDTGFSSSATFARAFKERFKMSASQWRQTYIGGDGKIGKVMGKIDQALGNGRKDLIISNPYLDEETNNLKWSVEMPDNKEVKVEIRELPPLEVAYVRHIGPYAGDAELFEGLFTKLMTWAGPRGLLQMPGAQVLTVYHDDPDLTAEDKLRVSACISVPPETKAEGEVGRMALEGGKYAVAYFEIDPSEYEKAWSLVMGQWLPQSGFQPTDGPALELYLNDPNQHPQGKHQVEICLPVKPL